MPRAAEALRERLPRVPSIAVVLGSGLSHLVERLEDPVATRFDELPGFPASGVLGHMGRFVFGRLDGTEMLLQAGRYHAYEGNAMDVLVGPVRVLAELGVEVLILTNAAGGIHARVGPGDLVLVDDHINLMFRSPLLGPVQRDEQRFPDMSAPYDPELQELALSVAADAGVELVRGTYAAVLGPSYETAAEVRMLGRLGADVVGMSTVPEVIVARALGMRCVAFSMVTNKATGLSSEPISHEDVLEIGQEAGYRLGALISGLAARVGRSPQSTGAK